MASQKNTKTTVGTIDAGVLDYTAGDDLTLDRELVEADAIGTAAHVTMLSGLRLRPPLFTPAQRKAVVRELAAVLHDARRGRFIITPGDQDVHLAIERRLTRRLGDLGKKVHTARSRNDQVAVDLRLYGKAQLLGTLREAVALIQALLAFAAEHRMVPMVGRTHLQPAMPSSVGVWASAHAEGLLDDLALLVNAYELNDQCPLGSAASYGVPLPIDRQQVSDLLGFSRPTHNVLYANHTRGKIDSVILDALGQTMITLSRFAQDLVLFTMPEFGYFRLPKAFCTGSSIMPQKSNPDVAELVRARAARVLAHGACVREILRASPSGYNRDVQETKGPYLDGFRVTRATLRILTPLVQGMAPVPERLRSAFTPDVFATDRALEMVAGGMPFRDAYHNVKGHLDELARMDPDEAIARKTHLGAPAGLDLKGLETRARAGLQLVEEEEAAFHQAISKLLGTPYPAR